MRDRNKKYYWYHIRYTLRQFKSTVELTVRTRVHPYSTRPYCATTVKSRIPTKVGF